jgi:hypothetical protein
MAPFYTMADIIDGSGKRMFGAKPDVSGVAGPFYGVATISITSGSSDNGVAAAVINGPDTVTLVGGSADAVYTKYNKLVIPGEGTWYVSNSSEIVATFTSSAQMLAYAGNLSNRPAPIPAGSGTSTTVPTIPTPANPNNCYNHPGSPWHVWAWIKFVPEAGYLGPSTMSIITKEVRGESNTLSGTPYGPGEWEINVTYTYTWTTTP